MKQLLNNPKFVGTLCVVALIMVYLRLFDSKPTYEPPVTQVQAEATPTVPPVAVSSSSPDPNSSPPSPEGSTTASIDVGWPEEFRRDPFQAVQRGAFFENSQAARQRLEDLRTDGLITSPPLLQLHAVFVDGTNRVAMINRAIVKEGEEIDGYVVQRIQREQVRLQGKDDDRVLRFVEPPKVQSSES